jgi:uncharacterized protein (DUF885 family)
MSVVAPRPTAPGPRRLAGAVLLLAASLAGPACTASRQEQPGPAGAPAATAAGPATAAPAPAAPGAGRAESAPEARAALRAFVDAHFDEYFKRFPPAATGAGLHTYDAELRGFTPEERLAWAGFMKGEVEALPRRVDRSQLGHLDRADYDVLLAGLKGRILDIEQVRSWEKNPSVYLTQASQPVFGLINRDFAPLPERMRAAVSRMRRVPEVFLAGQRALKNPPRLWTEIALQQAAGTRGFFEKTLPEAFAPVKDAKLQAAFKAEQAKVLAGLDAYVKFLKDDLLPRSNGDFAIGEALYRQKLEHDEGVTESVDSLLAWGREELSRTQAQFSEVAGRIQPGKEPMEVYRALGKDHPTPEQLVPTTRATLERIRAFLLEKDIITVPSEVRAQVAETPAFNRALSFASMSTPGPFETKATEAYYYVTPPDPTWSAEKVEEHMSFYNRPALEVISIHEAYPGHYVQFLWTNRVDSKVRRLMGSGSFSEGWGLYTEQMMLDAGYGAGPDADELRLNQLALYLQRLARYMVGLSMHTRGMTYEEGVRFFEQEAYMTKTNAEREARRGTSDPTYLVYTLGKKMIMELREEAEQRWGAGFTLKRFHDALVSYGYPPVPVVRELIFAEGGANPRAAQAQ